jgi:hypothetical protein
MSAWGRAYIYMEQCTVARKQNIRACHDHLYLCHINPFQLVGTGVIRKNLIKFLGLDLGPFAVRKY